jgi:hypothetical protein
MPHASDGPMGAQAHGHHRPGWEGVGVCGGGGGQRHTCTSKHTFKGRVTSTSSRVVKVSWMWGRRRGYTTSPMRAWEPSPAKS